MEYELVILKVEQGRLRQDDLINNMMINTFHEQGLSPCEMVFKKKAETEQRLREVDYAVEVITKLTKNYKPKTISPDENY